MGLDSLATVAIVALMADTQVLRVSIALDEGGRGDLAKCMASMPSVGEDGQVRAITMPMVLREALRQMAERWDAAEPKRVRK